MMASSIVGMPSGVSQVTAASRERNPSLVELRQESSKIPGVLIVQRWGKLMFSLNHGRWMTIDWDFPSFKLH
jgi:hypothetical protein